MEIYRDGGGSAAAGASAPITPSRTGRRRGLSSSSSNSNGIGGIRQQKPLQKASSRHVQDEEEDAHDSKTAARRERRKSTALTPKKPSDMNKRRRRKSLQEKKAAMTFGSGLDKGATATTTTTTKENTSCSSTTSTTKMAPSQVVTTSSSSRTKIRTPESKIVKPKASLSRIGLSSSGSGSAESSKSLVSTDTNITTKAASTKAHDMSSKASTAGTKTSTTPSSSFRGSSSDLRKFIQQRRKEIRSSAEKDTTSGGNGIAASVDAKDVGTVIAPAATAKTVRFEADVVATTRGAEKDTGSGTLMDLTDEFRQEVAEAKPKKELVVPEAGASLEKPSAVTATKTLPTLSLGKFQESLWLDFGDEHRNIVGKTRSMSFLLEAPQNDSEKSLSSSSSGYYSVEFERVPFKKGFNLIVEEDTSSSPSSGDATSAGARSGGADDSAGSRLLTGSNSADDDTTTAGGDRTSPTVLCIKNGDRKRLRLTWTPTEAGGVREVVHLKLPRGRIRITAHGKARAIDIVKKSKKRATNNKSVSRLPWESYGSWRIFHISWAIFSNEIFTHKYIFFSTVNTFHRLSTRKIMSRDLSILHQVHQRRTNLLGKRACGSFLRRLHRIFQHPKRCTPSLRPVATSHQHPRLELKLRTIANGPRSSATHLPNGSTILFHRRRILLMS